jgi:hypothetical protein
MLKAQRLHPVHYELSVGVNVAAWTRVVTNSASERRLPCLLNLTASHNDENARQSISHFK